MDYKQNGSAISKKEGVLLSYQIHNFWKNEDIKMIAQKNGFTVFEYQRDLSVCRDTAQMEYFAAQMGVRRRQLVCALEKSGVTLQAGAMQWMAGNVNVSTGVKGVGDLIGKAVKGKVTSESAIKPEYTGTGLLVTEPTYRHLILMDVREWGGSVVLDDGLFLACESHLKQSVVMRSNLSSAAFGGKGLFNQCLSGESGVFCVEADCPRGELIQVDLMNDTLKVDGNFAIAWSASLNFSVERATKSLIGSAASGEGLVNVYRGTGRVLMMPVAAGSAFCGTGAHQIVVGD